MGYDDFFEQGNKHHNHEHGYYHGEYDNRNYKHMDVKQVLINNIRNNPKIKMLLIIAIIFLLIIIVIAAIFLIPLLLKLFHFIAENGVQGLIDVIWNGTK